MAKANRRTYIALLRGINVGGRNRLPMATLRSLCERLGFSQVRTYIQSGNVLFEASGKSSRLAQQLTVALQDDLQLELPVVVLEPQELATAVAENPWPELPLETISVCFLSKPASEKQIAAIPEINSGSDEWHCQGRFIYLSCPNGFAGTKLTNVFFEKHLEVQSTTRNWRTVTKLIELSEKQR